MKLLVVEDHEQLSKNMRQYLNQEGYVCEVAANYQQAVEKLYAYQYDMVALDLMLPDGNGLDLLKSIKENWPQLCVLIISAKNALDDKIKGLNLGADDYLPKPFHLAELNARLKAIFRRKNQQGDNSVTFEEIQLNTDNFEVKVNDQLLDLTRKEFEMLQYLLINQNRVLTKQSIAEHLWGDYMDTADSFDFVYQHIKNLRKKITQAGGNDYIQTVYGVGYKFKKAE
ncbi:MAG: DNA-binding response regulator [Flammeovirgaceae bacterium]|nr:DNA-binding response regulator [Flammeovirgaceae bacterium]MBE62893.1 DNA-binding response regulator [Flammeovirgaceae bacterium]MBR11339.1 DNA-binding response regulator [Rickettsiales bacterium]HCX24477.1 DNA-binding response regulator [Cytophagales bacterium]|tara:strand:- start:4127 stop:4807 length:681 start_codon:yes stop_codon:yes gene_type:complete